MKEYFVNLFNYENWANKEIADLIVSANDLPDKPLSLMSHTINAQMLWLSRIKNEASDVAVWQFYPKSEIQAALNKSSSNLTGYIKNISEDDLKRIIIYTNSKGDKFDSTLVDILTHLTHHSAYHRGQIILLIKNLVTTLPYTDYIHYVRNVVNRET